MSHDTHDAGHPAKPFGNALGILAGLMVWWGATGGVVWVVYKLMTGGEPE